MDQSLAGILAQVIPVVILAIIVEYRYSISANSELEKLSCTINGEMENLLNHKRRIQRRFFSDKLLTLPPLRGDRQKATLAIKQIDSKIAEKHQACERIIDRARADMAMTAFFALILIALLTVEIVCLGVHGGVFNLSNKANYFLPLIVCSCLGACIILSMLQFFFLSHYDTWVSETVNRKWHSWTAVGTFFATIIILATVSIRLGIS